jgi:hypothetical protein
MNITINKFKELCEKNPHQILNATIRTKRGEYIIISVINSTNEQCLVAISTERYSDNISLGTYHPICNDLINAPEATIHNRNLQSDPQTIISLPNLLAFPNYKYYCYMLLSDWDDLNDDDIVISLNLIGQCITQIQNELI